MDFVNDQNNTKLYSLVLRPKHFTKDHFEDLSYKLPKIISLDIKCDLEFNFELVAENIVKFASNVNKDLKEVIYGGKIEEDEQMKVKSSLSNEWNVYMIPRNGFVMQR